MDAIANGAVCAEGFILFKVSLRRGGVAVSGQRCVECVGHRSQELCIGDRCGSRSCPVCEGVGFRVTGVGAAGASQTPAAAALCGGGTCSPAPGSARTPPSPFPEPRPEPRPANPAHSWVDANSLGTPTKQLRRPLVVPRSAVDYLKRSALVHANSLGILNDRSTRGRPVLPRIPAPCALPVAARLST